MEILSVLLAHSCGQTATKAEVPRTKNDDLYHILLENLKLVNITLNRDGFGFTSLWCFCVFLNGPKLIQTFGRSSSGVLYLPNAITGMG